MVRGLLLTSSPPATGGGGSSVVPAVEKGLKQNQGRVTRIRTRNSKCQDYIDLYCLVAVLSW